MMKYKIGDRVVCKSGYHNKDMAGKVGTVKGAKSTIIGVEFDECVNGHSCTGKCKPGHGWWVSADGLQPLNNHKIVITTDGKTTLARLYEGDKVIKSTQTTCSPDDTFDFDYGARLTFDRLIDKEDKPEFKPRLMYRSINNGTVGVETKYKDVVGRKLYVGDVVELFNPKGMSIGLKFISEGNVETDKSKQFVMGISGCCNGETGEIKGGWKIFKTRGYETLKHGEVIDEINYVGENT